VPYVQLPAVNTYYEQAGSGPAVVLLHGGLFGAESWFAQRDALAAEFEVYLPERRGHAHTPDVPGPLTYQAMADDTVAFLEAVVPGPAHLVGWSDGAVVGALAAAQRPDLVNRLVLIGQYFNPSGQAPDGLVELMSSRWREAPPAFLHEHYDRVSPDGPGHYPVFLGKMLDMVTREPDIPLSGLAAITAQTLVLQGDKDEVLIGHSAEVAAAIPGGRLAVLPGTHALPMESPDLVNQLLISFLRDGPPHAAWDFRGAPD